MRAGLGAACLRGLAWMLAALLAGTLAGAGSVLLAACVGLSQRALAAHAWLAWTLPLAGVLTVGVYRLLRVGWGVSTAWVIGRGRDEDPGEVPSPGEASAPGEVPAQGEVPAPSKVSASSKVSTPGKVSARGGEPISGEVPAGLGPAILAGTCLTILGGGSVGKEAAALQLGGSAGSLVGQLFARSGCRRRARGAGEGAGRAGTPGGNAFPSAALESGAFVRMGMAGAFAALFYAPVAATLFVLEVTRCRLRPTSVLPLALASACGALTVRLFPQGYLWRAMLPQAPAPQRLAGAAAVGVACALAALAFCWLLGRARGLRWGRTGGVLDPPWAHMLLGGVAVALLSHALGLGAYAGTGDALMHQAFAGQAAPWDFLGKAALTLLVLGVGFKGGEIMPVLTVGAALGCVVGPLAGADSGPAAALGAMCMLAACTNCPLAAIALGVEAFGPAMGWTLALGCGLAYLLSAPVGLYPQNLPRWPQTFLRRVGLRGRKARQ